MIGRLHWKTNQRQIGRFERVIDKLISLLPIFSLVGAIIQLDRHLDFQRTWVTQDEIDMLGEDFVEPSPAFGRVFFYHQNVGDPNHGKDLPIVLNRLLQ